MDHLQLQNNILDLEGYEYLGWQSFHSQVLTSLLAPEIKADLKK